MESALKYIVNDKGQKTSVLVPIKVWENLNDNYLKLQRKTEVLQGIKQGLEEAKKPGRNLQTLKDFIDESCR